MSLALTLSRRLQRLAVGLTILSLTIGVTGSAGCRFLSSLSSTQLLAAMLPSEVKISPTWMSPFLSAATVSGPPESSVWTS